MDNFHDEKEVEAKARLDLKISRDEQLADLKFLMGTPQGERFFWKFLSKCKTFSSIYEKSALIHYNSGQQDLGHYLMGELTTADSEQFFKIMKDNMTNK